MTKILGNLLSTIVFAVLFLLCLAFVAIRVAGLGTYIVTGGSMEPSIAKGSLVLVQPVSPSEVRVGDVVTFQQYGQTTTHRVIAIGRTSQGQPTFTTRGDANATADPELKTFPGRVGIVRGSLAVAGYVTASVQAYWRLVLTLIAAITFFACAGALVFRKETPNVPLAMPAGRVARPVLVTVGADDAWNAHLAWISRTGQRRRMVA